MSQELIQGLGVMWPDGDYFILFILFLFLILGHTSPTVTVTYFSNVFSLVMSVLYQLIKIYGSKRPGYRLFMNSSGCAIAQ